MTKDFLKITCIGDIAPKKNAAEALSKMVFENNFLLNRIFEKSDCVFGNFEAPITNAIQIIENKKYIFKTNQQVLKAFTDNFIFSIAKNHILT